MDRFAAISAFAAVVEAGSFARAAQRRGLSTSSLSRLVADLEGHLGTRLLNRTTRRLSLTESGQAFYERAVQLIADLDEAESVAARTAAAPRGTIRLTCSYAMGVQRLAPAIARFVAVYPQVRFDVSVSDRLVDLVEEGFDLAIRIGRVGAESLVARRLGDMRLVLAAAPDYLARHGAPQSIDELARHPLLTYAYATAPLVWRLIDAQGGEHAVAVRSGGPLHANSGDVLTAAAVAGLGIVCEPDFIVEPDLAAGRLVRLLPEVRGAQSEIWAVYPSRRHLSVKVRLFVDHLVDVFARPAEPAPRRLPARVDRPSARR
jgi:DNA-binding transcriptional LysR family regulator